MLAITTFLLLLPVFGAFSTSWADPYPYYLQPAYGYPEEYTTKILSIINKARTTEGLPALCNNKKLQAAAMRLCYKDAPGDYVWRFRSDQNKLSRLATDAGFVCDSSTGLPSGSPNCSNVGGFADSGEINTDEAVAGWVADFGDLLLGNYTMVGTAYAFINESHTQHYWAQVYATGSTEECDIDEEESTSQVQGAKEYD